MKRTGITTMVLAMLLCAGSELGAADTPASKPSLGKGPAKTQKDIVSPQDQSKVAKLLRRWDKEGTAAGNVGDFYDNRDGGHSRLNTRRFPQLSTVEYTAEQKKRRLHWGVQLRMLFKHVTIGNSSTASGDINWGSNTRRCLLSARAMQILYMQYTRNHLYVYPEHRDHDPGHNGRGGGYGDLFPANTPYVITSQGSSGSDRPFLEAAAYTLAAFRPQTKGLLVQKGLLMPTVQMILRACSKNVTSPADYLTGKAHPTVFAGNHVDVVKMAEMAHAMQPAAVPPMVRLSVVEEAGAVAGRDYFDVGERERLFDTPAAIARIGRSTRQVRRMVVSAERSFDLNQRKLKFHWVVLRGDADRVRIKPRNNERSVVELLVPFHERRPIYPGAPEESVRLRLMESTRVDIGAFVHNGVHYSAPAFVCFYFLDGEARTYDAAGRVVEVAYDYGDSTIGYPTGGLAARDPRYDITDWPALLGVLREGNETFGATLLRQRFTPNEQAAVQQAAQELEAACQKEIEPRKRYDEAEAARKKARAAVSDAKKKLEDMKRKLQGREESVRSRLKPADALKAALAQAEEKLKALQEAQRAADQKHREARRKLDEAQRAARLILTRKRPKLGGSVKERLEMALNAIKNDVNLYLAHAKAVEALCAACTDARGKRAFLDARAKLVKQGILAGGPQGRFRLNPVLAGTRAPARRLTKYERNRLEWLNSAILQNLVYPGLLNRPYVRNFVNPIIATPKLWRDVYHYDAGGRAIGWTRYRNGEKQEFTPDGALITKKDRFGRALEARTVQYVIQRGKKAPLGLVQKPGDTILHYVYDSDRDRVGRVGRSEKAGP